MCSMKIAFALVAVSAVVLAGPGGRGGQQQNQGGFGGQQGGFGGQNGGQGGFGGQQGNQGGFGGDQGFGGNQGGFGGNQGGQGGFGGNQGGHGGPPQPPFLQNVTNEARQAFYAIVTNSSLTISEIETQSEAWAETYGVSEQYDAFTANVTEKLDELKQNVTSVLTNLSSVLNSLETILENTDQTVAAQKEAIEELRQQSPVEVDTIFFIAKEVVPGPQGNQGRRPDFNGFPTTTTVSSV